MSFAIKVLLTQKSLEFYGLLLEHLYVVAKLYISVLLFSCYCILVGFLLAHAYCIVC